MKRSINIFIVLTIISVILQATGIINLAVIDIDDSETAPNALKLFLAIGVSLIVYRVALNLVERFQASWLTGLLRDSLPLVIALSIGVLLWFFGPDFTGALGLGNRKSTDERVMTTGFLLLLVVVALSLNPYLFLTEKQKSIVIAKEYKQLVKITSECRADRIMALRDRANSLSSQGNILLILIIIIVIGVASFIPVAGEIAGQDATSTNAFHLASTRIDTLRENRNNFIDLLISLQIEIAELEAKIETESQVEGSTTQVKQQSVESKQLGDEDVKLIEARKKNEQKLSALKKREIRMSKHVEALEKDLITAEKLMPKSFKELGEGIKSDSTTRLLISANVTRFGVLALAIYLVQILINLYRFNTRLAAYYRSLADALTLYDVSMNKIGSLIMNLSPPFDFGKEPTHLSKLMIEKFDDAISKLTHTEKKPRSNNTE